MKTLLLFFIALLAQLVCSRHHDLHRYLHNKRDVVVATNVVVIQVDGNNLPTSTWTAVRADATAAPVCNVVSAPTSDFVMTVGAQATSTSTQDATSAVEQADSEVTAAPASYAAEAPTTSAPVASQPQSSTTQPVPQPQSTAAQVTPQAAPQAQSSAAQATPQDQANAAQPAHPPSPQTTPAASSGPPPSPTKSVPVAASSSAPPPSSTPTSGTGLGISYSPYFANSSCKGQAAINEDFEILDGYDIVRIYGTECGQIPPVMSAAKGKGMKVMLGVFDIGNVSEETTTLIQAVGNDWDMVSMISIGNEVVQDGGSVGEVTTAVGVAHGLLAGTGFTGDLVAADTFDTIEKNPGLCQVSDVVAANAHAFFDSDVVASGAGQWLKGTVEKLQTACSGKRIIITETGWPSQGGCNGQACPSLQNQQAAIASIKATLDTDVILFDAYNDLWKQDSSDTFGCEKYWGIYGNSKSG